MKEVIKKNLPKGFKTVNEFLNSSVSVEIKVSFLKKCMKAYKDN